MSSWTPIATCALIVYQMELLIESNQLGLVHQYVIAFATSKKNAISKFKGRS